MRRILSYILLIVMGAVMAACSKLDSPQRRAIQLSFASDDLIVETKADADAYTSAPSSENPFKADVWFSLLKGQYKHAPSENPELSIPARIPITFTSTGATDAIFIDGGVNKNLLYPLDPEAKTQSSVYCVGLYPAYIDAGTNWTNESNNEGTGTKFTHTINGSQDLMYADQIEGSYSNNFEPQSYKHLLTWVKINVSATSSEAAGVWGQVEEISIGSRKSEVSVEFNESEDTEVTFSGDTLAIEANEVTTKNPNGLSIIGQNVASVFCSAPYTQDPNTTNSSDPLGYWITVKTTNLAESKSVFVPITWTDENDKNAIGKLLLINLYFNEVAIVSGVCTLQYWEATSEDLYLEGALQTN